LNVKEQALWMLQRLVPDSGVSNESLVFAVSGRLDVDVLSRQVKRLVRRHPALRTVFPELHGTPSAVVLPETDSVVDVVVVDEPTATVESAVGEFVAAAFDLTRQPPIRAGVWRYPNGDVCCLAMHHIVYDAWTAGVLFTDVVTGYNSETEHTDQPESPVAPAGIYLEAAPSEVGTTYWRDHVAGLDPRAQRLTMSRERPATSKFAGATRRHEMSEAARAAVGRLAQRHRATENIVLMAAYYLLLAQHGAGPDVVVGVSVDVRGKGDRGTAGYHVNTLPIRMTVSPSGTVENLLQVMRKTFFTGLRHRDVPYEAIQPGLDVSGSDWRTPLFRHMFNYRPIPLPRRTLLGGNPVEILDVPTGHSRQDLEFIVETAADERGWIRAVYSTEVFDESDIAALQERYEDLLIALAARDQYVLQDMTRSAVTTLPPVRDDHNDAVTPELDGTGPDDTELDDTVAALVELWRDVLNNPGIGPSDNFFLSGGHSLTALRMLLKIAKKTGVQLTLDSLLEHPTAVDFARYVRKTS
jgi:acyl carrier protein